MAREYRGSGDSNLSMHSVLELLEILATSGVLGWDAAAGAKLMSHLFRNHVGLWDSLRPHAHILVEVMKNGIRTGTMGLLKYSHILYTVSH